VLLASPSNPTGTSIDPELARIVDVVRSRGGITLDRRDLPGPEPRRHFWPKRPAHWARHVISINSFSKYFNMTGWRLGWLVVPESLVPVLERLAQNLFICASTVPNAPLWPVLSPRAWPNTSNAAPNSKTAATIWCRP
jgi:aspartate/methionine/tyrosine aminotransferase